MNELINIIKEEIENFGNVNSLDLSKLMGLVDKYPNSLKYYKTGINTDKFILEFPTPKDPNMQYDDKVVEYEYHHEPIQGIGHDEPHWTIRIKATSPTGKEHSQRSSTRTNDTNKVYKHMIRTLNALNKLDRNTYNLEEMVSKNRIFQVETLPQWENMLETLKTNNDIDNISIVGKDDNLSLRMERTGYKPVGLGPLNRAHMRNKQYQTNIINYILKTAPQYVNRFQPKVKRLSGTASIEDKLNKFIILWHRIQDDYIKRVRKIKNEDKIEELRDMFREKYFDVLNDLWQEVYDTPEWHANPETTNHSFLDRFTDEFSFGDLIFNI